MKEISNSKMQITNFAKGITIIELLVVSSIIVVALVALLGLATFSLRVSTLVRETAQANNFAQEAMEAVRNFRDGTIWNQNGLGILTSGISYYPLKSGDSPPKWQLAPGEESINGFFTRKIVFSNVQRDSDDNIVETGGTNDPNTKKVTINVLWKDKKVEIITYLTNWKQ